ncbi:MAG: LysR family transcriptional regulator [Aminipila sp.]
MTLQQLRYVVTVANTHSMNEAAKQLFIAQPTLSGSIKDLEEEMNISIFQRTNKGVTLTAEGEEFLGYARQVLGQVELLEEKYLDGSNIKKKFGVSTQHYSFAVKAFVEMVKGFDMNEYEFAIRETRTSIVLDDVEYGRSEIGILYINEFNKKVLYKIFKDKGLIFHELFECNAYVYLWRKHPLAGEKKITLQQLEDYPCLCFEQGEHNSFYFAEELLSTYDYKKTIKACDRATMLNLMVGLHGYTICSGIIVEELNGNDYISIPLDTREVMQIGYVMKSGMVLSNIGKIYIEELKSYQQVLKGADNECTN